MVKSVQLRNSRQALMICSLGSGTCSTSQCVSASIADGNSRQLNLFAFKNLIAWHDLTNEGPYLVAAGGSHI